MSFSAYVKCLWAKLKSVEQQVCCLDRQDASLSLTGNLEDLESVDHGCRFSTTKKGWTDMGNFVQDG